MTANRRMCAARYHGNGVSFSIDTVEIPALRPTDVLVQVEACGVVPNTINVVNGPPFVQRLTPPAIFGLDPAGVVVEKGPLVHGFEIGDRVYVNPLRYCGSCRQCRMGNVVTCDYATLNGYFGIGPKSAQMLADYPYGGYAEYMAAPHYSLVKLPAEVSFETAARWGYLGTSYSALRRAKADISSTVLINGASGTLGLGATLFSLALGVPTVLAVGRSLERLVRVKELAPDRIRVHSIESDTSIDEWARMETDGHGADIVVDALPSDSPPAPFLAAAEALARGGRLVNIGGVHDAVPIVVARLMTAQQTYMGSLWFTTAEGHEMADLASSGTVKLDVFEHNIFGLDEIEHAMAVLGAGDRSGGFSNFVIAPQKRRVADPPANGD